MKRARAARRAAVAIVLLAVVVLGTESGYVATRRYLPADAAPRVAGSYGDARPAVRLLLLGDSTAAGVGASTTAGSVGGRLAAALATKRRVTLGSVAVAGARAADLPAQVSAALKERPDVVLILIGANDATHVTRLGTVGRLLDAAVRRLRAAGVAVVVAGCPDLGAARAFPQPLRAIAAARGRAVADRERAAAAAAGAAYVDLGRATGSAMRRDARTLSADRFHPSDRGYALWAQALQPAVLAALA